MFWKKRKEHIIEYNDIKDFSQYRGYYCLIRREGANIGLFSHYLTNAANVAACIQEGLIPVIDMQHVENAWNRGNIGKDNPWEYYFEQPFGIGVNDIEISKTIYQNGIVDEKQRPNDSMEFLTNCVTVNYWRTMIKNYMNFNKNTTAFLEERYEKVVRGKSVLGVLCRGTDYIQLRPKEHPIQPTVTEMIEKVREIQSKKGYEVIYLATEDQEIYECFQAEFGDQLIGSMDKKIRCTKAEYLNTIYEENQIDIRTNSLEYVASIYILSKCNALIAGRTSGSVAAFIMSEGYEYFYFFNKGRYGEDNYMPRGAQEM